VWKARGSIKEVITQIEPQNPASRLADEFKQNKVSCGAESQRLPQTQNRKNLKICLNSNLRRLFTFARNPAHADLSKAELVLGELFDLPALFDGHHWKAHDLQHCR
jgi:hypothetical protein